MNEKIQYDYCKLRGKIVEKFGSIKKLSKNINISNTTLYKKLSGKEYFNQKQIEIIRYALGINETEINEYFFVHKVKKYLTKGG